MAALIFFGSSRSEFGPPAAVATPPPSVIERVEGAAARLGAAAFPPSEHSRVHVAEFGILGLFLAGALLFERLRSARAAALAVAMSVVYGGLDELHQLFTPGRSTEFGDVLRDASGAAIGVLVAVCLAATLRRAPRAPSRNRFGNRIRP